MAALTVLVVLSSTGVVAADGGCHGGRCDGGCGWNGIGCGWNGIGCGWNGIGCGGFSHFRLGPW